MTDYISRDAFKAEIRRLSTHYLNEWDTLGVLAAADRIPAADVVPVVLCKDCKCYRQSSFVDKHMECSRSGFPVHSIDFCSFGEKMEES